MGKPKCRICLNDCRCFYNLFSNVVIDKETIKLAKMMESIANVQIILKDKYPKIICAECYDKLMKAYEFKIQCEKSYQELLKTRNNGTTPKSENVLVNISANEVFRSNKVDNNKSRLLKEISNDPLNVESQKCEPVLDVNTALQKIRNYDDIELIKMSKADADEIEVVTVNANELEKLNILSPSLKSQLSKMGVLTDNKNFVKEGLNAKSSEQKVTHISENDENLFIVIEETPRTNSIKAENSKIKRKPDELQTNHLNINLNDSNIEDDEEKIIIIVENDEDNTELKVDEAEENNTETADEDLKEDEQIEDMKIEFEDDSQLNSSQDNNIYSCMVCKRIFKTLSAYKSHMGTHENEKEYACDFENCGARFFTRLACLRHYHARHVNTSEQYVCKICGKRCGNLVSFGYHKRTHKKKYSCTQCNKQFSLKVLLNIHLKAHQKQNLALRTCQACGTVFNSEKYLIEHRAKTWDRNKPCNRSITKSNDLTCEWCHQVFSRIQYLRKHQKKSCPEKRLSWDDAKENLKDPSEIVSNEESQNSMHLSESEGIDDEKEDEFGFSSLDENDSPMKDNHEEYSQGSTIVENEGNEYESSQDISKKRETEIQLTKEVVKYNMVMHNNELKYECGYDNCQQTFLSKSGFLTHAAKHFTK